MTERERLIELIKDSGELERVGMLYNDIGFRSEQLADHLLASGVIVPPCKVGDMVYYFNKNPLNLMVRKNTIYEAMVVRIVNTRLGIYLVIQICNELGCTEIPNINEFGKNVFLTREEAEKALKEEQNHD